MLSQQSLDHVVHTIDAVSSVRTLLEQAQKDAFFLLNRDPQHLHTLGRIAYYQAVLDRLPDLTAATLDAHDAACRHPRAGRPWFREGVDAAFWEFHGILRSFGLRRPLRS